ncbi:MAG: xanthine dehydrogenase family protein subunit M [Chloroflexi bacterium]|nr:MAG: xanthine dehydrogenase family protein subunit M [Chloroflexota bacterium]
MQDVKYVKPKTLQEAVSILKDNGPTARVLAGGTDIIVMARERRRDTSLFVDIKAIPEMNGIHLDESTGLTIGAATPLYLCYRDPMMNQRFPSIVDSSSLIGGTAVQGRATLVGNLCNSGPAGDSIPTLMAMEGVAHILGPNGERDVPVVDFCTGPGRNVLELGEIVVNLHFPTPRPNSSGRFLRFIPRNEMDIAVVNCSTNITLDANNVVTHARLAIGAVAATPLFVPAAGEALVGKALTDETIAATANACRDAATPIDDMRGSIRQRKHLAYVLAERTIRDAVHRIRGEHTEWH